MRDLKSCKHGSDSGLVSGGIISRQHTQMGLTVSISTRLLVWDRHQIHPKQRTWLLNLSNKPSTSTK